MDGGGGGSFIAGSIIGKMILDKTGWDATTQAVFKEASQKTEKLGKDFQELGSKFQSAGKTMAMAGASMLAPLAAGVVSFANFDAAMTESTAIMGDLSKAMEKDMVNAARQVAKETTFTSAQAAKAYYYIASAGYDAAEAVKVLPVAAKFAQAGMFDLERATTMLADSQSALGMRIRDDAVANMENMARVADVLSRANILANASIEQFAEALTTRAGAALRLVNKDVEEGAAVLATFASAGIKGSEAGTRLDVVLRDLQTRAIENKEVFAHYGVTVFDSTGKMRNMADVIGDLEKALAGASDEKKRSILMEMEFQDRSVASILNLVGMSSEIRRYETELRKASGTTEEIAKKQLETFNSQLKLTKHAVSGMAGAFGETLIPALTAVVEKVRGVASAIADFAREHKTITTVVTISVGAIGTFLTVVGGGVFILGSFMRALGSIIIMLPILKANLTAATVHLAAFKAALLGSIAPLAAIAAAAIYAHKTISDLIKAKEQAVEADYRASEANELYGRKLREVADAAGMTRKEFVELSRKYGENYTALGMAIKKGQEGKELQKAMADHTKKHTEAVAEQKDKLGELGGAFGDLPPKMQTFGEAMEEWGIKTIKQKAQEIDRLLGFERELDAMLGAGKITAEDYGKAIKEINAEFWELGRFIETATLPAREMSSVLRSAIPVMDDIGYATKTFDELLEEAANQMGYSSLTIIRELYNIRREFLATIGIMLPAWPEVSAAAVGAADGIGDAFDNLWSDVARGFGDTFKDVLSGATSLKDSLGQLWGNIKDAFFSMLGEMATKWIKTLLTDMVGSAMKAAASTASTFSNLGKTVGSVASSIGTVITTLATSIATAIGTIATGIGTALVTLATAVASAATILAAAIVPLAMVGALAIALYAGFKLVGGAIDKLLGLGGGDGKTSSWIHETRDRMYDVCNWLNSVGKSIETGIYGHFEKFDGIKGSVDETREALGSDLGNILNAIREGIGILTGLKGAQRGYVSRATELVMTHGTPSIPEFIIPAPSLKSLLPFVSEKAQPERTRPIEIREVRNEVHINGQIITDREYTRRRLIPEIINALDSNFEKTKLQTRFGVA